MVKCKLFYIVDILSCLFGSAELHFADINSKLLREEFQQFVFPNLAHSRQRGNLYTATPCSCLISSDKTGDCAGACQFKAAQCVSLACIVTSWIRTLEPQGLLSLPVQTLLQMRTELQHDCSLTITHCVSGRVGSGVVFNPRFSFLYCLCRLFEF